VDPSRWPLESMFCLCTAVSQEFSLLLSNRLEKRTKSKKDWWRLFVKRCSAEFQRWTQVFCTLFLLLSVPSTFLSCVWLVSFDTFGLKLVFLCFGVSTSMGVAVGSCSTVTVTLGLVFWTTIGTTSLSSSFFPGFTSLVEWKKARKVPISMSTEAFPDCIQLRSERLQLFCLPWVHQLSFLKLQPSQHRWRKKAASFCRTKERIRVDVKKERTIKTTVVDLDWLQQQDDSQPVSKMSLCFGSQFLWPFFAKQLHPLRFSSIRSSWLFPTKWFSVAALSVDTWAIENQRVLLELNLLCKTGKRILKHEALNKVVICWQALKRWAKKKQAKTDKYSILLPTYNEKDNLSAHYVLDCESIRWEVCFHMGGELHGGCKSAILASVSKSRIVFFLLSNCKISFHIRFLLLWCLTELFSGYNYEVIVIDDGSPDGTLEVAKKTAEDLWVCSSFSRRPFFTNHRERNCVETKSREVRD